MPSLWGEKATFVLFLWVRGLYQLINDIVKMNQQAAEEEQDREHLWKVGNLTEMQKIIMSDNDYCNWMVLDFPLIYCSK